MESHDKRLEMKQKLIEILRDNTLHELTIAQTAYEQTAQYTKSDDLKSEGKYDTRGIEAGMLAGAQLKRVEELKQELELLASIPVVIDESEIKLGSVVELSLHQTTKKYFLSSTRGGTILQVQGEPFLVISVFSPLGDEMLGLSRADEFDLETASGLRHYKILSLF